MVYVQGETELYITLWCTILHSKLYVCYWQELHKIHCIAGEISETMFYLGLFGCHEHGPETLVK